MEYLLASVRCRLFTLGQKLAGKGGMASMDGGWTDETDDGDWTEIGFRMREKGKGNEREWVKIK